MGEGVGEGEGEGEGSCDNHHLISDLSEDVLIQILLWLPVISLLRFKSVCKSWRSIIQSSSFINLHHAATLLPSKLGGSSLFCCGHSKNDDYQEKKKDYFFTLSGEEFEVFEDLGIPPTLKLKLVGENLGEIEIDFLVVGCCNGLICLHDVYTRNVALWNPAIKQFRILPKPSNLLGNPNCFRDDDCSYTSEDFVRFGIDIKTNDHKVLQITSFIEDRPCKQRSFDMESPSLHERRVHVYNLSTDSWRCITDDATLSTAHPYPDDPYDPNLHIKMYENDSLYLNGSYFFQAMYWTEERNSRLMLLSFDFTAEIFTTIQPPYDLRNRNACRGYVSFIPFGEKLALVDAKKDQFEYYVYDIWVLNEQQQDGVKESSWTKLYTIGSPDSDRSIEQPLCDGEFAITYSILEPLCITNNGEFAIIYGQYWHGVQDLVSKLQLLNLITGETKVIRSDYEDQTSTFVCFYKPCLVPIGENVSCNT